MHENKEYTQAELGAIVKEGISVAAIDRWPLIKLPESLSTVARATLMEDPDDASAQEELDRALLPRHGLRTAWGCIVVEFSASDLTDGTVMVEVSGYLNEDPYLQLSHLRQGVEEVGLFLSDVANAMLESEAELSMWDCDLEWQDNYTTSQLFNLLGFIGVADNVAFMRAGGQIGDWLAKTDIHAILHACRDPKLLSSLDDESRLPITRSIVE